MLAAEGVVVSRWGIGKFLQRYTEDRSLAQRRGSGRLSIVAADMRAVVEDMMQADDETTISQVHQPLADQHGCGPSTSIVLQ